MREGIQGGYQSGPAPEGKPPKPRAFCEPPPSVAGWECWVAYDCEARAFGIFPNEIDALRFATDNNEHMLRVKRIQPGDMREQLK